MRVTLFRTTQYLWSLFIARFKVRLLEGLSKRLRTPELIVEFDDAPKTAEDLASPAIFYLEGKRKAVMRVFLNGDINYCLFDEDAEFEADFEDVIRGIVSEVEKGLLGLTFMPSGPIPVQKVLDFFWLDRMNYIAAVLGSRLNVFVEVRRLPEDEWTPSDIAIPVELLMYGMGVEKREKKIATIRLAKEGVNFCADARYANDIAELLKT